MAVDFLGALGVGSGLDSKNLVESLVAAERAPVESRLNIKIAESEDRISAYGMVMSSLQLIETAFEDLNDVSDFANYTSSISGGLAATGEASFSVSTDSDVSASQHEISITAIAEADRWVSGGFDATSTSLNAGSSFSLTFAFADGDSEAVSVDTATPQGLVDAVNEADIGVTAVLIDTGASSGRYKISLTGELGADNAFTLSNDISSGTTVSFPTQASTAVDASLTVDGVAVTRETNTIDDLLDGVTLNLVAPSASAGTLRIAADTSVAETRIRGLVETYNTVKSIFDTLTDPDSDDALGGSLYGDSTFRTIENRVRELFTSVSSTPGDSLSYLADLGVEITRYGTLEINETRLASALQNNYSDVVTLFSADTEKQTRFGAADRGIAGDALYILDELMGSDGPIRARQAGAETQISGYEEDLENLELRMQALYNRYLKQFTAMETIVDQMNSTREYLQQQIDALPFNNREK
jgi:flagellar hook-associated protein 2